MLIDLTHTLTPSIATWTLKCGFQSEIKLDYSDTKTPPRFRVQKLSMHAGIGTHMDAPSHCIENGKSISDLPIENFIAKGICIDVSEKAIDAFFVLQKNDIEAFEMNWGLITPNSLIIIYTAWSRFWLDPKKYVNDFQFPSVSREAALYLIEKGALGIAVDTMSPDLPSQHHPVHELFLGRSKYIIENVANAELLPRNNFRVIALPIKAKDCTEAPIRLLAEI